MKYTVVWVPAADDALARLWLQAADRQTVSDAADRLEVALGNDPDRKVTPLGKLFVYEDFPLAVLCIIDPGDCMVRIVSVKRVDNN